MAYNNGNNNNGNRIPSHLRRGDRSTLTNEMIRDQHIQSATHDLIQSHQQFIANRQEMETMRIAQQLQDCRNLQQQPNATTSYHINKFRQSKSSWGLHRQALSRSLSHLSNQLTYPSSPPASSPSFIQNHDVIHHDNSRLFTALCHQLTTILPIPETITTYH